MLAAGKSQNRHNNELTIIFNVYSAMKFAFTSSALTLSVFILPAISLQVLFDKHVYPSKDSNECPKNIYFECMPQQILICKIIPLQRLSVWKQRLN